MGCPPALLRDAEAKSARDSGEPCLGNPIPSTRDAPSVGTRPHGACSIIHEQKWHQRSAVVSEDFLPGRPASFGSDGSRFLPSRVTGWGPQAQATLVGELMGIGEKAVAAKVGKCGARPLPTVEYIEVKSRGQKKRHLSGVCHCGRFQVCPCCTPYLMAKRLEALTAVAPRLSEDGELRFFMVVISARHRNGVRWKRVVDILRKMIAALRQNHEWRGLVEGFIRLLETTFGKNGHHPHEHLLLAIRATPGWTPEPFFEWIKRTCERVAKKAGGSCSFRGHWWSEVDRNDLIKAVKYFGTEDKMGTKAGDALLEFNSATKHEPAWCIPVKAYAEVYLSSTGLRWFSVAGCWKTKQTAKTDEELDGERESTGTGIAHILARLYRSWTRSERLDRRAVIYDSALTDEQVVDYVSACGGAPGPAPRC